MSADSIPPHTFNPYKKGSREQLQEAELHGDLLIPGYHPGCRICHKYESLCRELYGKK